MARPWNQPSKSKHLKSKRRQDSRLGNLESLEGRRLLAGDMMDAMADDAVICQNDPQNDDTTMMMTTEHNEAAMASMAHEAHPAHPAAMALVSAAQATNTVVTSGNWSDPSVWENGALPQTGARIVIPQGMTLTLDSVITTEFKTIGIHGTLSFATNVDTELRVDTIVSSPLGRFEMGTTANPIPSYATARIVFADDGVINTTWDPEQISRGAILQGPTEIHGAETTHRATLAVFPSAGETSIQLNSVPTNWNPGDEIVITGTQGSTSDEVRVIESD